jgi:hydroxymethylglutaryl-CoA reductase (NADPH)
VSFLTLHILNLCTTLTPATAVARHNTLEDRSPVDVHARAVDIFSPAVTDILSQVQAATAALPDELLVKVHPPLILHATPAPAPAPARHSPRYEEDTGSFASSQAAIDSFLENWTHFVGDPVMSKWIVCLLALSVGLNGLLLRGLGLSAVVSGPAPKGAVRFESRVDARSPLRKSASVTPEIEVIEEKEPEPKAPSPVKVAAPKPLRLPSTPMLDAVDAKLLEAQAAEARARAAASAPAPTAPVRPMEELIALFEATKPASIPLAGMNDEEVIALAQGGKIAPYALEKVLEDLERAVRIRRALICKSLGSFCCPRLLTPRQPDHRPRRRSRARLSP